ncbi:MAG: hypothetical protein JNJ85_05395 [Candidatus Kapabacteria bacterium]|nr:hypothetical protein [Candidatus Kapabacteria bacterium]
MFEIDNIIVNMENLIQIADAEFWHIINQRYQSSGGVYKVVAVENGLRIPVSRFLDTDDTGVLYIGKATSFIVRVINLKKSLSPEHHGKSHKFGMRYKSLLNIAKQFRFEMLYIELIQSESPALLEKQLLQDYLNKFGEVPPLNAIS